jgi:hypothetical protein
VNFIIDPLEGRSTLRPANVLVYRWVGEKYACVDLNEVSPIVGLTTGELQDKQSSKLLHAKWQNMREYVLTINMYLYHLDLRLLIF